MRKSKKHSKEMDTDAYIAKVSVNLSSITSISIQESGSTIRVAMTIPEESLSAIGVTCYSPKETEQLIMPLDYT